MEIHYLNSDEEEARALDTVSFETVPMYFSHNIVRKFGCDAATLADKAREMILEKHPDGIASTVQRFQVETQEGVVTFWLTKTSNAILVLIPFEN